MSRGRKLPNFGWAPDSMIDAIPNLTHLEGHLFWYLCMVAERTGNRNGKSGEVCLSRSELARRFKVKRFSLTRAIDGLMKAGLVRGGTSSATPGTSCVTPCLIMCHYVAPHVPHPDTSCVTESPQPQPEASTYAPPIRSEDVSENEVKTKKASATTNSKKSKSKSASKKKPSATAHLLQWDPVIAEVVGDAGKVKLREKVYQHYDDLGEAWINATWASWITYCDTHRDYVEKKKDLYLAALNWFSGDAKKKRERQQ